MLSQTKLTYKQEKELSYLSNGDKLKILKKVAGGAVFATVLIATLKKAKKRNDRLEQQARDRDRDDWHDHWFGGGGWGSGSLRFRGCLRPENEEFHFAAVLSGYVYSAGFHR